MTVVEKLALGNAKKCNSLDELLQIADVISVHVDGRKDYACMISTEQFEKNETRVAVSESQPWICR
jgi:D-3-phosphoglycerate dehydrogenase